MQEQVSMRWVLLRTAIVLAAALTIGLAPLGVARAESNESTAQKGADLEELLCQSAGGATTTTTIVDSSGQANSTQVQCHGGLLNGMNCTNVNDATDCEMGLVQPPRLPGAARVPGPIVAKPALATPAAAPTNATPVASPPSGG